MISRIADAGLLERPHHLAVGEGVWLYASTLHSIIRMARGVIGCVLVGSITSSRPRS
jgi:hypothetical protein